MGDVVISASTFHRRASRLLEQWKLADPDASPLDSCDCILVVAGNSDEDNPYRKGSAIQTYLLGYEFPSTLVLLTKSKIVFVTSASKAKLLKDLPQYNGPNKVDVEVLTRTKDEAENKKLWDNVIEAIGSSKVGTLPKDKMVGKFVSEWTAYLGEKSVTLDEVDCATGVSYLLAAKDDTEVQNERFASRMAASMMSYFSDVMSAAIDEGKKITHEQMAEQIENKMEDERFWKKQAKSLPEGIETGFGDWCYSPIIQSGGNFDLKSSAQSDDQRLKSGVVYCSLGIRYKSYCSNVGRTFMIDPHQTQEKNYLFLIELQKFALAQLKDGAMIKDFHEAVTNKIHSDRPDLEPYLVKNFGFATGLEFRDSAYSLMPKTTRRARKNMVFSLNLGFNNVPDPANKDKTYALCVIDTVKVGADGSSIFSEGMKTKDEVLFYMEDEDEKPAKAAPAKQGRGGGPTAVVKSKLRGETRELDNSALVRRKQHQKELMQKRRDEGLDRFAGEDGEGAGAKEKKWKAFTSYRKDTELPERVADRKIMVDVRRNTVILPINGYAVPFHINTLKSVVKQEEGDHTVLRFMFVTPGAISGKKEDTPFEDPRATFIRGITYRSLDSFRYSEVWKEITDLKKAVTRREQDMRELADVIEQDQLVTIKGKRPIRLQDVQVRPVFDGKRQAGDVEIHTNGIRYQSTLKSDQTIDILFNNVRHLFFQPCDNELIVVLHVHLKNPIMIGKRKTKDVQFFREVSDQSFDETGNKKRKRNFHDEDELEAEQDERKRRAELNRYFKAYADKMVEAADGHFEVDVPFRELGFTGVPFRSNVLLQPTTDALIFVTEPPFLVITIEDIEVAHLERVQYGLKNFDLVFVFRDFQRPPVHINTIPSNQLDNVKNWLDEVDVPFSEGPVNLNWTAIMKTVNEDPYEFFNEGGWGFLNAEGDPDEAGSDEEGSSEGSAFEMSESDFNDDEDDESDFSDASASDSGSASGDSDDESGADWDDMEKETIAKEKRAAEKKGKYDSDSDTGRSKKKSSSKNRR